MPKRQSSDPTLPRRRSAPPVGRLPNSRLFDPRPPAARDYVRTQYSPGGIFYRDANIVPKIHADSNEIQCSRVTIHFFWGLDLNHSTNSSSSESSRPENLCKSPRTC